MHLTFSEYLIQNVLLFIDYHFCKCQNQISVLMMRVEICPDTCFPTVDLFPIDNVLYLLQFCGMMAFS